MRIPKNTLLYALKALKENPLPSWVPSGRDDIEHYIREIEVQPYEAHWVEVDFDGIEPPTFITSPWPLPVGGG